MLEISNDSSGSNMVVAFVEKITEKSPLHFSMDRNVNASDLISMTFLANQFN